MRQKGVLKHGYQPERDDLRQFINGKQSYRPDPDDEVEIFCHLLFKWNLCTNNVQVNLILRLFDLFFVNFAL